LLSEPWRKKEHWCSLGAHHWVTTVIMGIPVMVCKTCGATMPRAIKEGTMTKQDIRRMQKKEKRPMSTYEIMEKIWEDKYGNTR